MPDTSLDERRNNSNPLGALDDAALGSNTRKIQFPSNIRSEEFYTVFRIKKRAVDASGVGRLRIRENTEEIAELVLPLPPNLGTVYGANYNNGDLGLIGTLGAGVLGEGGGDIEKTIQAGYDATLGKVVNAFKSDGGFNFSAAGSLLAETAGKLAGRSILNSTIGAGLSIANNPYQAVVYSNPEFRTHSFSYNLFATNSAESFYIRDIVRQFKLAMHPDFQGGGAFFGYPDIVQIEHHVGSKDNPFIFKIQPSALESFSVNYHADGTPSYFENGTDTPAPTNVQISMTFRELNILTKDQIREGF